MSLHRVAFAVAAALLLSSCGTIRPASTATHNAAPPETPTPTPTPTPAPSTPWRLFARAPIVTYSPANGTGSPAQYGVVFRTRGRLPRNRGHGTRGQALLNGFGLQGVAQIGRAGTDACYDGQLSQVDGPVDTVPPLFPYVPGQRVTVGYRVGRRAARPITVVASRGPVMDDAQASKLAGGLGCHQVVSYGGRS